MDVFQNLTYSLPFQKLWLLFLFYPNFQGWISKWLKLLSRFDGLLALLRQRLYQTPLSLLSIFLLPKQGHGRKHKLNFLPGAMVYKRLRVLEQEVMLSRFSKDFLQEFVA